MSNLDRGTLLLTGATGYVGGRLLRRLEAGGAHRVRCLTRRPQALQARVAQETEVAAGDALEWASLRSAMEGVDTAYYLIHSMDTPGDFEGLDRAAAANFATAAREAHVRRIIYLGGLGNGHALSAHLASRQEVGDILRSSGVPTIEFRASIVIGSGSASYEIVRALVETLPVMLTPRWVETRAQPIAIEDLLQYLLAALNLKIADNEIFEIGGADRVTYAEIIREYAQQRRLRRRLLRSPLLTPKASSFFLGLITPVYGQVAGALVESLRNETVVHTRAASERFPIQPRGLRDSIQRALVNEDHDFAETRWSDALPADRPNRLAGASFGRRMVSSRAVRVDAPVAAAFDPIQRVGGQTGWYAADWFWSVRGVLDTLRGGVGLRRGRRDPHDLRAGDIVDFWRVESLEPSRLLRLVAEMKIPGRLWLQFETDADPDGGARIRQTTVFDPAGYVGMAYWYLWCPVHQLVFENMLRGIARAVSGQRSDASARGATTGRRERRGLRSERRRMAGLARHGKSRTRIVGS